MVVIDVSGLSDFNERKGSAPGLVVVDFSASWCGPCRMIKPKYEELSEKYNGVLFLCVMEGPANTEIIRSAGVRAFPTFQFFNKGNKVDEIQGADADALEAAIVRHQASAQVVPAFSGAGHAMSSSADVLSAAEAREARLRRFGAAQEAAVSSAKPSTAPSAYSSLLAAATVSSAVAAPSAPMDVDTTATLPPAGSPLVPPPVNEELLREMLDMGFLEIRARRALMANPSGGVGVVIDWLEAHQADPDIDDPIPLVSEAAAAGVLGGTRASSTGPTSLESGELSDAEVAAGVGNAAASLRCGNCGKLFRDMTGAELHANKTGHANFEESREALVPLSAEEKAAKVAELRALMARKRSEREAAEKADALSRERARREAGAKMQETKEEMEAAARRRATDAARREKEAYAAERERLRAELARDKAERAARGGVLSSKLGVDGYNPVAPPREASGAAPAAVLSAAVAPPAATASSAGVALRPTKSLDALRAALDQLSQYRAGGDGVTAIRTLGVYVGNVLGHPGDEKYRNIKTDNPAFKKRVGALVGGVAVLRAVGFSKLDGGVLCLMPEDEDVVFLGQAKEVIEEFLARLQ